MTSPREHPAWSRVSPPVDATSQEQSRRLPGKDDAWDDAREMQQPVRVVCRLFGWLVLVGLVLPLCGAAPPPRTPPEVKKLITDLGDDDVDVRKSAAKKLERLGRVALPELRRASKEHADADVRLRAVVVAAAIERKLFGPV